MNCIICESETEFYFKKDFAEHNLYGAEYYRCHNCGFVFSETHFQADDILWENLNSDFHTERYPQVGYDFSLRNPPYLQQAFFIYLIHKYGLVEGGDWLDWGSGKEGILSNLLSENFGLKINNYDKYMTPKVNSITEDELKSKYKLVVTSAVFEHVRDRKTLDGINDLVSETGCLAIHVVVCENIPQDPNWFYFLSVHCAVYTNKSMQILMNDWGYTCSIYCVTAKIWVFFKQDPKEIEEKVDKINFLLKEKYLHFKIGFMDYWK